MGLLRAEFNPFTPTSNDQAEYLAVMAVYREPENMSWRDIDEMPGNFFTRRFDKKVRITLEKNRILLD